MRIAITGASGFIGSNLVKDLMNIGYTNIVCVDKYNTHNYPIFYDWESSISDINSGFVSMVDFVFHLGANSDTRASSDDLKKSNVIFSNNLLKHCNGYKVPLVFASSGAIYGHNRKISSKPNPLTEYGISKLATENLIKEKYTSNAISLRYHNVYGYNESHKGNMASIVSKYIDGYLKGEKSHLLFENSKRIKRDFIHVRDVNKINILMLDFYQKHGKFPNYPSNFDIGTGSAVSFQHLAEEVAKYTHLPLKYIPNPYNSENYQFYTLANTIKIRNLYKMVYGYDYKPMSIKEGVKKVFKEKVKLSEIVF
jgi:nucleoside-diphosphate-sugar epimerase